jgi:hypothetical protein
MPEVAAGGHLRGWETCPVRSAESLHTGSQMPSSRGPLVRHPCGPSRIAPVTISRRGLADGHRSHTIGVAAGGCDLAETASSDTPESRPQAGLPRHPGLPRNGHGEQRRRCRAASRWNQGSCRQALGRSERGINGSVACSPGGSVAWQSAVTFSAQSFDRPGLCDGNKTQKANDPAL